MRLGGMVPDGWRDAEAWAKAACDFGYGAVTFPLNADADIATIDQFVAAAKHHELVIAEVGVWNNVLTNAPQARADAIAYAIAQLELADYIKAKCCVNIAGSFSEKWDGPHPDNLTPKGYEAIVSTTQKIIDAARPTHTVYSLEPMPWMYPNTAEAYLSLIKDIDRKGFGVHLDLINVITSLDLYFDTASHIRHWFETLGDQIVSCHAKDIQLQDTLTLHLDECRPGTGQFDYAAFMTEIRKMDDDFIVILEHMTEIDDYKKGVAFFKEMAAQHHIPIVSGTAH